MIVFLAVIAWVGAAVCASGGDKTGVNIFIAAELLLFGMAQIQNAIRERGA